MAAAKPPPKRPRRDAPKCRCSEITIHSADTVCPEHGDLRAGAREREADDVAPLTPRERPPVKR
jgi:hypothetical protein